MIELQTNELKNRAVILEEQNKLFKNIQIAIWLFFSCFIVLGLGYLFSGTISFIEISGTLSATIIVYLLNTILGIAGALLLVSFIFLIIGSVRLKEKSSMKNKRIFLTIFILSVITPIYYLLSSFIIMLSLLIKYDGTDYSDLQSKTLALTTPITYVLFLVILILLLVFYANFSQDMIGKQRIIVTAILLIPFALGGIFFNTYLLFDPEISGLNYFIMNLPLLDYTSRWMIAYPYMVLFLLLAGMMLELNFSLKNIQKKLATYDI